MTTSASNTIWGEGRWSADLTSARGNALAVIARAAESLCLSPVCGRGDINCLNNLAAELQRNHQALCQGKEIENNRVTYS